jgi:hypothetical protein
MEVANVDTVIKAGQGCDETILKLLGTSISSTRSIHGWQYGAITFRKPDGLVMLFVKHTWPGD